MFYKSFILATTLVICSIDNAIAAETFMGSGLDREQRLSTIEDASANNNLESFASNILTNPTELPASPSVMKASEQWDTESLSLPVDVKQAWSSGVDFSPKSAVTLHEISLEDGVTAPIDQAKVNTGAEFRSSKIQSADSASTQYLDMNYYAPQNNLLMGDRRFAQVSDSPFPEKVERPISASEGKPTDKKNYVGITVGSILNIPAYGINAKFGIADNISVRPFIQFAKVPDSILNLEGERGAVSISGFLYGLSATYDFNVPNSPLAPYAGIGLANASGTYVNNNPGSRDGGSSFTSPVYVELGADYKLTDEVVINANYKFQDLGFFSFGAGYRF